MIRTESEYDQALEKVSALMDNNDPRVVGILEDLVVEIEEWEDEHYPIG